MQTLNTHIPSHSSYVLVDQGQLLDAFGAGSHAIPFIERNGQYGGIPQDASTAIDELDRMRQAGVGFPVLAWPVFWLFDLYPSLAEYMRSQYRCVLDADHVIIFSAVN